MSDLKGPKESQTEWTQRIIEKVNAGCADSPSLNETDERIVAELSGIRLMLGCIAHSLAELTDAGVDYGIRVKDVQP